MVRVKSGWRPRSSFVVMAALAGVTGLSACKDPAPKARPAGPPPAVTVVRASLKEVTPAQTFIGRVEAMDRVDLRARVEGFLEKRLFEEGADVKEGDLLFVIEKAPYTTKINQIKAAISGAEGTLRFTNQELQRQETLAQRGVAALARVDEARSKQAEAQGDLLREKASLEKAELDLGYTDVVAPLSGRIGRAQFSVGSFVSPSSGTLATIVRQDPIYATFPVTQREVLAIRKRAEEAGASPRAVKVRLRLADGSIYDEVGSIDFVDVQINPSTDAVTVRAKLANPRRLLIDGQLVTVILESGTVQQALFVPQQALQLDQAGHFLLALDADNKAQIKRVRIGAGRDGEIVITDGLAEGDRVVTEGLQKVRPQQVVQPTEARGAARPQ